MYIPVIDLLRKLGATLDDRLQHLDGAAADFPARVVVVRGTAFVVAEILLSFERAQRQKVIKKRQ